MTYRTREVRLTHSTATVDEERVESRVSGLLGDGQSCCTCQFVRFTRDERVEGLEVIEGRQVVLTRYRLLERFSRSRCTYGW